MNQHRIGFAALVFYAAGLSTAVSFSGCQSETKTTEIKTTDTKTVDSKNAKEEQPAPAPSDQFSWLLGSWNRIGEKAGHTTTETWLRDGDNKLSGFGLTVADTKKAWSENMVLEKTGDDWYYIANPSQNAAPTRFKLTTLEKHHFIAENPDHDFPQKIEYRFEEKNNRITATVSAANKKIEFVFQKAKPQSPTTDEDSKQK